jgi:tRNA A37 threonylcarbamoyladenosine biosynthesis protein TsaE
MPEGSYISFKRYLSDFAIVVAEWRQILQDFAEKEYASLSFS